MGSDLMPDATDANGDELKKDFENLVRAKMQSVLGGVHCAVCGKQSWHIFSELTFPQIQDYKPGPSFQLKFGGRNMPSVPVICTDCGNTLFFNLFIVLGDDAAKYPPFNKPEEGK